MWISKKDVCADPSLGGVGYSAAISFLCMRVYVIDNCLVFASLTSPLMLLKSYEPCNLIIDVGQSPPTDIVKEQRQCVWENLPPVLHLLMWYILFFSPLRWMSAFALGTCVAVQACSEKAWMKSEVSLAVCDAWVSSCVCIMCTWGKWKGLVTTDSLSGCVACNMRGIGHVWLVFFYVGKLTESVRVQNLCWRVMLWVCLRQFFFGVCVISVAVCWNWWCAVP